jgi:hypothetical protein
MESFRIHTGWRCFFIILASLLIGLFIWVLLLPFIDVENADDWFFVPIALCMISICVIGIVDTLKSKLIIHESSMKSISIFSKRELCFVDIKGFTISEYYIFIYPKDKHHKKIKISKYISNYEGIANWLSVNFINLYELKLINEQEDILKNAAFGFDEEARLLKQTKAKRLVSTLNIFAFLCSAWVLFFPEIYYELGLIILICIPLVVVIIIKFWRGLITLDYKGHSSYPSLFIAFLMPSLCLAVRTMLDFNIFDEAKLWIVIALTTLVLTSVLLIKQSAVKIADYGLVLTLIIIATFYSYGFVIFTNCRFDNGNFVLYRSAVINKYVTKGKSTSYHVILNPWGPQIYNDDIEVSKKLYNSVSERDIMNVYLMPGLLGISWYEISDQ